MTDDAFDPTDLEDLALDLDEFCKQRPPAQQAALKKMFGVVASHADEITGGDKSVTTTRHAENESAYTAGSAYTGTVSFNIMGVHMFDYHYSGLM